MANSCNNDSSLPQFLTTLSAAKGKASSPTARAATRHIRGAGKNPFHMSGIEVGIPSSPLKRPKKVTSDHSHFPSVFESMNGSSRLWHADYASQGPEGATLSRLFIKLIYALILFLFI